MHRRQSRLARRLLTLIAALSPWLAAQAEQVHVAVAANLRRAWGDFNRNPGRDSNRLCQK